MAFRRKQYSDEELLSKLKDGSLPPADFTHEAHVRLVWILSKKRFNKFAYYDVSRIIKEYADAIGEGQIFHETLTYASVMVILEHIKRKDYKDFYEFIEDNLDLMVDFKSQINKHYSEQLLQSDKARNEVVAPDLISF